MPALIARAFRRLREQQAGFTLVELMVACVIGTIVLLATFMMLDSSVVLTGKVTDRVDRTQRARLAMERMTRTLRSQVCPAAGTPALFSADDYSVTFFSFMGAGAYVPDKIELSWDTNTNSIIQRKWAGSGTAGSFSWPGAPTTTTLLTDVRPTFVSGQSGPRGPVFKYFVGGSAAPRTTPLNGADLNATSEVDIQFMTYPQGRGATGTSTTLQSQVFSRTADPNALSGSTAPECA